MSATWTFKCLRASCSTAATYLCSNEQTSREIAFRQRGARMGLPTSAAAYPIFRRATRCAHHSSGKVVGIMKLPGSWLASIEDHLDVSGQR